MSEETIIPLFKRKSYSCPLCNATFSKEEVNPTVITDCEESEDIELRQVYKKHPSLGLPAPLIYSIVVCPSCYYAAFPQDLNPQSYEIKTVLADNEINRKKLISSLFTEEMNFRKRRNIELGFLSYLLAMESYKLRENYNKIFTFKKAISSLRASWIAKDILDHYKESSFSIIHSILFRKATKYYSSAFAKLQSEKINKEDFIGPDTNNNWGYNGFLYLTGYLNYKLAEYDKDKGKKTKTFTNIMKIMNKILKSNNNENNALTNNARKIHNLAKDIIEQE